MQLHITQHKLAYDHVNNLKGSAAKSFCRVCSTKRFTWEEKCLQKLFNHDFFWTK